MADRFDKFTEPARRVLSLAQEEAQRFRHNYIGTEHLLLGLMREDEGVAFKVLANLGVRPDKVRSAVDFIIGHGEKSLSGEIADLIGTGTEVGEHLESHAFVFAH